jgi:hypothetical protein
MVRTVVRLWCTLVVLSLGACRSSGDSGAGGVEGSYSVKGGYVASSSGLGNKTDCGVPDSTRYLDDLRLDVTTDANGNYVLTEKKAGCSVQVTKKGMTLTATNQPCVFAQDSLYPALGYSSNVYRSLALDMEAGTYTSVSELIEQRSGNKACVAAEGTLARVQSP